MTVFDLLYTADWDGEWLTVVADLSSQIGGGLQSTRVIDPVRATTPQKVRHVLLTDEFVPVDLYADIPYGRFPVRKI